MICSFKQQNTFFPCLKYCTILCWHNIPWEIITSRANLVYITVFNERICLLNVSRLKFFRTFISVGPIAFIEIWTVVIRNIEQRCSKNKFIIYFLMAIRYYTPGITINLFTGTLYKWLKIPICWYQLKYISSIIGQIKYNDSLPCRCTSKQFRHMATLVANKLVDTIIDTSLLRTCEDTEILLIFLAFIRPLSLPLAWLLLVRVCRLFGSGSFSYRQKLTVSGCKHL